MLVFCLLADILVVFRRLEKVFQKDDVLITDVFSAREAAVRKLETMADAPFSNGKEMNHLTEMKCDLTAVADLRKQEAQLSLRDRASALSVEIW